YMIERRNVQGYHRMVLAAAFDGVAIGRFVTRTRHFQVEDPYPVAEHVPEAKLGCLVQDRLVATCLLAVGVVGEVRNPHLPPLDEHELIARQAAVATVERSRLCWICQFTTQCERVWDSPVVLVHLDRLPLSGGYR